MDMTETENRRERSTLEYAMAYIERGFAVVPLHWMIGAQCSCGNVHDGKNGNMPPGSRGKHPFTPYVKHGVHGASKDPAVVRGWFEAEPRLNIGIATGKISGVTAVDIDPRDGGDLQWEDLLDRNKAQQPDTVVAATGGGGSHILFRWREGDRISAPGKGIQIKGDGGYIVVEPSVHHSGKRYTWNAECDPLEGAQAIDPPDWILAPRTPAAMITMHRTAAGYLDPGRIADIRAALAHLDADAYQTWVQVGMSLHSTDAAEAFALWDEWSQRSAKYEAGGQRKKWLSFGLHEHDNLHVESIFVWARDAGWSGISPPVTVPVESIRVAAPADPAPSDTPSSLGLLELPGVLGDVVRWANATAPKAQPLFAITSALALGSVMAGRRYRTTKRNWSSLYFVNVGKSGCGKEHARTVIESILLKAELPYLIGPAGYTSDSGVLSALIEQPSHISIIDEIGALLGNMKAEGAWQARQAVDALVSVWGNLGGVQRAKGYSTMSSTDEQRKRMAENFVHCPALTLLGMTTPRTFYGALTEASVEGGFLSRLLVTETDIGRQPIGEFTDLDAPPRVIEWCQTISRVGRTHLNGVISSVDPIASTNPQPIVVEFDAAAERSRRAYELDVIANADKLEEEGLGELEGRSVEKAMRLALILAVSREALSPRITGADMDWSIAFVRSITGRMVRSVRQHMHGSKFAAVRAQVYQLLLRAQPIEAGKTERELAKGCRPYAEMEPRQRRTVMDSLVADGMAAATEQGGARGRKRLSWVATEGEGDE